MKALHRSLLCLLMAGVLAVFSSHRLVAAEPICSVKWDEFLGRHDLKWERLPRSWHEGAFTGNGLLGAMIYSEGTNALQWDVGRSDVTDRGFRIVIGSFTLVSPKGDAKGTMRLDLWDAEARGKLKCGEQNLEWRSFTHSEKLVNVIELIEEKGGAPFNIVFQHAPAIPAREQYRKEPVPPELANPNASFGKSDGVSWCLQAFSGGGGYCIAWAERELSPGHRLFFWTVDNAGQLGIQNTKAIADIRDAIKLDLNDLVASHRAWWHKYYPQSFLSIPDTRMEGFYWIQMYKLASGTRADRPALDLMGPWFHSTPWPRIWWNLNIQLTYWPVYTANRLDLGQSLVRMIDSGRSNLINNAPEEWRPDSAVIKRTSSYDCRSSIGNPIDGQNGREFGNLTWALHNYWLQYRYSGDEKLLRDGLYPVLKRSIAFYLHLLVKGEEGRLHLPVAVSPEYPDTAPDTNYDLSLLRWGLMTLIATNERLGLEDPMESKWRETLANLTPNPVDPQTGFMIGAGVPFAKSHRHYSHLFSIYPLHLVDPQSSKDRPLAEKSIDHWMSLNQAFRGYSFTGASAMSAWLGRKEDSVRLLNQFLDSHVKANTMYLEAGPVIESPLSAAASLHEILLQSWSMEPFGSHIRVFPSVPDEWKDVSFDRLLAEGAFEVSAVRRGGKTKFVQLKSLVGSPCRVSTDLEEPVVASGDRDFKLSAEKDRNDQRTYVIDLKKGETVVLTSSKDNLEAGDWNIQPVVAQPDRMNFYGLSRNYVEPKPVKKKK
jgi:alpha-L-fucosidase 2